MKYFILLLSILILAGCSGNPDAPSAEQTFAESPGDSVSADGFDQDGAGPAEAAADIILGGAEGFPFEYKGLTIHVGIPAEPIIQHLGEPLNYFEAPSCAFEGVDRTYFYSGIELHTFPVGDNQYVLAVLFTDDSVETPEGVYLGMPVQDALALLGGGYERDAGLYTYTKGRGSLGVMTENGVVADLSYNFITG